MFAYLIETTCGCGPECAQPEPRKTMLMLHLDPESIVDQDLASKVLEMVGPELDDEGVIQLNLDSDATGDVFGALEGVFALGATCHRLLQIGEEKDEFKEEELNVEPNI